VTPAEYADAPPGAHPAIVDRLVEQLHDVTLLLDTADAQTFAADDPHDALRMLSVSCEKLLAEAAKHRPVLHNGPEPIPRF
jgi:hypothetical protein